MNWFAYEPESFAGQPTMTERCSHTYLEAEEMGWIGIRHDDNHPYLAKCHVELVCLGHGNRPLVFVPALEPETDWKEQD